MAKINKGKKQTRTTQNGMKIVNAANDELEKNQASFFQDA